MKLLIAEKIYQYRKKLDMTQEELASTIGVSAQAVSGWERNCGYPDITLLPALAHTFGITIDELMGNDELGVKEDIERFYEKMRDGDTGGEEQLRLSIEYYHKYPNNYNIAETLIMTISYWEYAKQPEYLALLREAAEKIIAHCADNDIRTTAIHAMCCWAEDREAERWLNMLMNFSFTYSEVYERRLWTQGKNDEARVQHDANNLALMLYLIIRDGCYRGFPARSIAHNTVLRTLIQTFGENGNIPDGWLDKYAFITLRLSAGISAQERSRRALQGSQKP